MQVEAGASTLLPSSNLAQSTESGGRGRKTGWFESTLSLQRASLEFCRACRSVPSLLVQVDAGTPAQLFSSLSGAGAVLHGWSRRSSRVPTLQAHGVRWDLRGVIPTQGPSADDLSRELAGQRLMRLFVRWT